MTKVRSGGAIVSPALHVDMRVKYSMGFHRFHPVEVRQPAGGDDCRRRCPVRQAPADIDAKRVDYMQKWDRMLSQDRAVLILHADDGA